jgi:hypothetical protein
MPAGQDLGRAGRTARPAIVNLRLALLERRTPEWLKRRLLDDLARLTADALGGSPPRWAAAGFDSRLRLFADFSAGEARRLLAANGEADLPAARVRLYENAVGLGDSLRRRLRVRRGADVLRALTLLYRHIGIDLGAAGPGEVEVSRCAFAQAYDERVCELISALDEGVAAGLSGGAQLRFTQRLTGGAGCCRAYFDPWRAGVS